jgi:hypothetical protein
MGYRMLKIDHLYEVYRRVVAGESKRSIAIQTGWDTQDDREVRRDTHRASIAPDRQTTRSG